MNRARLATISLLAPLSLVTLPGCVVWDIKNGIEESNANLQSINESFAKVEKANELLGKVEGQLDRLEAIQTRLDSIDTNLTSMDERMATLQVALDSVKGSLISLRKTISNIDSTIPFLKISGDNKEEKDALDAEPTTTPEPPAAGEPAAQPAEKP